MLQRLRPIDPCELIEMTCSAPVETDSLFSRSTGGQTAGETEAEAERGLRGRKIEPQCLWEEPGPSRRAAKPTLERKRAAEEVKGR